MSLHAFLCLSVYKKEEEREKMNKNTGICTFEGAPELQTLSAVVHAEKNVTQTMTRLLRQT